MHLSGVALWVFFYLPLVAAAGAILYHLAAAFAAWRFRLEPESEADFAPPVSILKPVRGIEHRFYESLATFFRQDYPAYEIIFGLDNPNDAAKWTIAQLQREFPHVPVKVLVVSEGLGTNPKMAKLQRMIEAATHEVMVISDADIRVPRDYLRKVVRPLADAGVGMVTCLYRGVAQPNWASRAEALGMSGDFAGQVILGRMLGGMRFGLGATMATRKKQIGEIGGLAPWADYLADDYILGNRIAAAGYRVHLSHLVVETVLPLRSWRETLGQMLRWARTIRTCSPRGYPGLLFAYGAPLALLPITMAPQSWPALIVLGSVVGSRWLAAWMSGVAVCRDPLVARYFWLLPVKDLLALMVWAASFSGREVTWRQSRFRLEPSGKIRPA